MSGVPQSDPNLRPGILVHIGAGQGDWLPEYLSTGYSAIILIEADPDRASELARRAEDATRVQVIEGTVTGKVKGEVEQVDFNFMNDSTFNSIRTPGKLNTLLPGIALKAKRKVKALSLTELFEALPAMEDEAAHALVIEAPGAELAILKGLSKARKLQRFSTLRVRCDAEVYYQKGSKATQVLSWMSKRSYRIVGSNLEDPDWPVYDFSIDVSAIALKSLKAEFRSTKQALENSEKRCATLEDELAKTQKGGQEALEEANVQRATLEAELARSQEETRDALQKADSKSKTDRDEDVLMALRLQTIAQNDKMELQERYARLQDKYAKQKELLLKLTQKLASAAEYLRRLPEPKDEDRRGVLLEDNVSERERS